jgi:hypothetical protein
MSRKGYSRLRTYCSGALKIYSRDSAHFTAFPIKMVYGVVTLLAGQRTVGAVGVRMRSMDEWRVENC